MRNLIRMEEIENHILFVRGHKVMLDEGLARLYGVSTKRLNEQVRRNRARFPKDFMFQLTPEEARFLRSHFATSSSEHGGRRYLPYVFTEQGIAMLSSVLNSERAVQVNIAIMRAFVKLRKILSTHREFARKLSDLERKWELHDEQIHSVFEAIRQLMAPEPTRRRRIGFHRV